MADPPAPESQGHQSFSDKLKHPFHELKEKLKNSSLHDAKVSMVHTKSVPLSP